MSANTDYFEQPDVWNPLYRNTPVEQQRLMETLNAIPKDVHSILDAGSGNGVFLNSLLASGVNNFSQVIGADLSFEALKSVKAEKIQCSMSKMPFGDKAFDIVTCLEVLEHIHYPDFKVVLSEISRVARRYILITVPNQENLIQKLVICPHCFCCFNPWHHVRFFSESKLPKLFDGFSLIECKNIGPEQVRYVYHPVIRAAHLFLKKPVLPKYSICPQCYYQENRLNIDKSNVNNMNQRSKKYLKDVMIKYSIALKETFARKQKMKKWLLALYSTYNRI